MACRNAANYNGLMTVGEGYEFTGKYTPKGCYAYSSGKYNGRVFYGSGGTLDQMKSLPGQGIYRPVGYDCNYQGIQKKGIYTAINYILFYKFFTTNQINFFTMYDQNKRKRKRKERNEQLLH